jgi:hypothetical protein
VKQEILKYLLEECDLDPVTVTAVIDRAKVGSVLTFMTLSPTRLETLVTENGIPLGDASTLTEIKDWVSNYYEVHGSLPDTLDEWKGEFTSYTFTEYIFKGTRQEQSDDESSNQGEDEAHLSARRKVSVKVTDFPDFNGRVGAYHPWVSKFAATASLAGYSSILEVDDMAVHDRMIATDPEYAQMNQEVYDILQSKTADGTAATKVTKWKEQKDGARAFDELSKVYDKGGDRKTFASKCLKNLIALEYRWGQAGGVDQYINEFTEILQELDGLETLSDQLKKTIFLRGIVDKDFDTTKELCKDLTFDLAVLRISEQRISVVGRT